MWRVYSPHLRRVYSPLLRRSYIQLLRSSEVQQKAAFSILKIVDKIARIGARSVPLGVKADNQISKGLRKQQRLNSTPTPFSVNPDRAVYMSDGVIVLRCTEVERTFASAITLVRVRVLASVRITLATLSAFLAAGRTIFNIHKHSPFTSDGDSRTSNRPRRSSKTFQKSLALILR